MEIRPLHVGVSADANSLGGLNRFVRELTAAQRREGIEASHFGSSSAEIDQFGIASYSRSNHMVGNLFNNRQEILRMMTKFGILNYHFALTSLPILIPKRPAVFHFHGPWYLESRSLSQKLFRVQAKRLLENIVYRRQSNFITLSKHFADMLLNEFSIPSGKIKVIPPGITIDPNPIRPDVARKFRNSFGVEMEDDLVVCVRRLVPRMGHEILIESISQIRKPPKVLLVGEGPLREFLERKIRFLNLEQVIKMTGKLSEDDLRSAYQTADLSVVPSISLEGFGLITLESLSFGTPVIASNCGGLSEAMNGLPEQFLVTPKSVDELSRAIKQFFEDRVDFSDLCFSHARKFDWKSTVASTNEIYLSALS